METGRNSQFVRPFRRMGREVVPALRWNAKTVEEHKAWRRRFRRKLGERVGHMPHRVPLKVRRAECVEFEKFTRRKVYIQSERDYWVPAFLFVPKGLTAPAPAVVCLHGHSGVYPYIREGTEAEQAKCRKLDLDYAPLLAEHGYVTLALIQRGWNETTDGLPPGDTSCHKMAIDSFLIGMTPVGLKCWDASRALDYLETLPEVDAERIGVAGLSGGGMVALFWPALERRVKLSMIAGYYCTFRESIFSVYHCICNCVPGLMQWGEMREIAALIAPRPALIISGIHDPIFPIKATRRAYRELKEVYKLLGAETSLDKDFFDGPHAWSNRKTLAFLKRHFG